MAQNKSVSICIPTYNRPDWLKLAAQSALDQTYPNIEIVISDNCSPNPEVERYCRELSKQNSQIRYFRHETNIGALANFNFVIQQAQGDYICLLADDDYFSPLYVEKLVAKLHTSPNALAACSDITFINEQSQPIDLKDDYFFYNNLELNSDNPQKNLTSYISQYGWYNFYMCIDSKYLKESELFYMQTWGADVIWGILLLLEGNIVKVDEPLFFYRMSNMDCVHKHLCPQYNIYSQIHPYADSMLKIFDLIFKTPKLSLRNKFTFYGIFWKQLFSMRSPWRYRFNEFPLRPFFSLLFKNKEYRSLFLMTPLLILTIVKRLNLKNSLKILLHYITSFIKSKFNCMQIQMSKNSILIIEPNICHAEFCLGYANYFTELGYSVDIVISIEAMNEKPFEGYSHNNIHIYSMAYSSIIKLFCSKFVHKYKLILLTSQYDYRHNDLFLNLYKLSKKVLDKLWIISHSISEIETIKDQHCRQLFVLTKFNSEYPVISPHYFGIPYRKPNALEYQKILFAVPGVNGKNISCIVKAVKKLLAQGINNFHVTLIGNVDQSINKNFLTELKKIDPYLCSLGRVSFTCLYQEVSKSDFLISLLNDSDPVGQTFLNNITTGAKLISLGFNKPLIIQKIFADSYGLSRDTCICYTGETLAEAMSEAIHMTLNKYTQTCSALHILSKEMHNNSLMTIQKNLIGYDTPC